MFEQLSDKLTATFENLRGRPRVTEADLDDALRDVRVALLEADVNLKVVRQLVATVRERALGEKVLESITGAQQVVKIVHDALVEMLGGEAVPIARAEKPPTVILLVGLQGSGKTTTAAKIANVLRKQGRRPTLVAADVYRPAAIDQLKTLGKQLGIAVSTVDPKRVADDVAKAAQAAPSQNADTVIVDTAGRLHIDDAMMTEVEQVVSASHPDEVLLVVDAMTGQDAVEAASAFKARLPISGLVLTKVDSDARGGASLSIRAATGVPVKYLGVGEKLDALEVFHPDRLSQRILGRGDVLTRVARGEASLSLRAETGIPVKRMGAGEKRDAIEPFHPDRIAQRILGMGDVVTLVERAQEVVDQKEAEEQTKKLLEARFTFDDFYQQLQQLKKMGPLGELMKMIPGMGGLAKQLPEGPEAERELKRIEAIISSMTRDERADPTIINGSRRRRIASGSGTTVADVNQLIKQFGEMQKLMKQMGGLAKSGRLPRIPGMPRL